jgi:hypothetical protein
MSSSIPCSRPQSLPGISFSDFFAISQHGTVPSAFVLRGLLMTSQYMPDASTAPLSGSLSLFECSSNCRCICSEVDQRYRQRRVAKPGRRRRHVDHKLLRVYMELLHLCVILPSY